jgi:hypothetical protein
LELPTGELRRSLEDGDEVTQRRWCEVPGFRRGKVLPAAQET